jgi:hypothetical protein
MKSKQLVSALFAIAMCSIISVATAATPLVAARQKVFGIENVDANTGAVKKDKVIFSWLTNTTYAVSVLGRVIMLDSYVTRLELTPGRTPFVVQRSGQLPGDPAGAATSATSKVDQRCDLRRRKPVMRCGRT